jgi:ESCRT-I complex subunit TSG101
LVLQGTIAIVFRGQTYQLLVDIYLPPGYPIRPPVSYVRLAENMYLKENHPHVGSDGMVYMPYTHEWNPRTHSLIEMVVAMSSVFSADPPVFTRSAPAPPPPPPPLPSNLTPYTTTTSSNFTNSDPPPPPAYSSYVSSTTSATDSDRYLQEQIEKIMALEAEEANRAAEIARSAAKEEEERAKRAAAQKEWEERKKGQTKDLVNKKIQSYLQQFAEETKSSLAADWRDQEQLKHTKKRIDEELKDLAGKKSDLEEHILTVDKKTKEIEEWLEESKSAKEVEPNIDDVCQPVNKLHAQMLELSAENAALTDVMYFLDRGMYSGQIDCATHLKTIRKLAKQQFLIRAHLIKISQVLGKSS